MPPVHSKYASAAPLKLIPDYSKKDAQTIPYTKMVDGVKQTVPVPIAYGKSVEEAMNNMEGLKRTEKLSTHRTFTSSSKGFVVNALLFVITILLLRIT